MSDFALIVRPFNQQVGATPMIAGTCLIYSSYRNQENILRISLLTLRYGYVVTY